MCLFEGSAVWLKKHSPSRIHRVFAPNPRNATHPQLTSFGLWYPSLWGGSLLCFPRICSSFIFWLFGGSPCFPLFPGKKEISFFAGVLFFQPTEEKKGCLTCLGCRKLAFKVTRQGWPTPGPWRLAVRLTHLLPLRICFPSLVFKGISHYWK